MHTQVRIYSDIAVYFLKFEGILEIHNMSIRIIEHNEIKITTVDKLTDQIKELERKVQGSSHQIKELELKVQGSNMADQLKEI